MAQYFPVQGTGGFIKASSGSGSASDPWVVGAAGSPAGTATGGGTAGALNKTLSAATSTTIIAANTSRLGIILSNNTGADLFIVFGSATASNTAYTFKIPDGQTYENPPTPIWTGVVKAYSVLGGDVMVTE